MSEPTYNEFYQEGARAMLESIRSSLRAYPHGGGDIEVMAEVDRIVQEAIEDWRIEHWRDLD